jgi:hypothetical protein
METNIFVKNTIFLNIDIYLILLYFFCNFFKKLVIWFFLKIYLSKGII